MSLRYRDRRGACSVPKLGAGAGGGCITVLFICCLMMLECDGRCVNMETEPLCAGGSNVEVVRAEAAEAASAGGVVERMNTVEQAAQHTHLMAEPHPYRDHF